MWTFLSFTLEYVCLSYHKGEVQSITHKRHCFGVRQNLNCLLILLVVNALLELISKISMSSLLLRLVFIVVVF